MKKIIVILSIICLTFFGGTFSALASNDAYDAEVAALRHVKNAKVKPINARIKTLKAKIEAAETDTSVSESKRVSTINSCTKEIVELEKKKKAIQKQYNADKKKLKAKYK